MVRPRHLLLLYLTVILGLAIQPQWLDPPRALLQPLGWTSVARVIGSILVVFNLWFTWFFERLVKTKKVSSGEGRDPDEVIFQVTTACCMTAAVVGMFLYVLGAHVIEVWAFASVAIASILFWAWRYRRLVLKPTSL